MFNKFKENTIEIKNIENLLKNKFPNIKILKHDVKPLTEFGENFGSEILKIDITIEENDKEKVINAVGKMIPPTELQLKIFNTQVTFHNEIGLYTEIVPALHEFEKEYNQELANYFPELYGARTSLDPKSQVVDLDGIILLENLQVNGFRNIDRQKGFDLDMTKIVLRTLANFHATTLALRIKKPEIFNSKVKPYLSEWLNSPPVFDFDPVLSENPKTAALIPRVKKLLSKQKVKKFTNTWATITHNDFWVNNIMIKESNGNFKGIKLVDFQLLDYGSPLPDVIFFLFDSVQVSVLQYHFEKLLQYYYKEFIQVLHKFKVDTSEFTEESFQEELNQQGPKETRHSLLMLFIILAPKGLRKSPGKAPKWNPEGKIDENLQLAENNNNFSNANGSPGKPGKSGKPESIPFSVSLTMKEKIWFMVEEAAKRNWI